MSSAFERMMKFSSKVAMLVSSQNKVDARTRDVILPRLVRKSLVEAAQLAADRRLAVGALAEISLRLPGGKIAINRAETWFARAADEDFTIALLTHPRALIASQIPAPHLAWHLLIYNATPAEALFLCQPIAVLRVAETGVALDPNLLLDAAQAVGEVGYVLPEETDIKLAAVAHRAVMIRGIGLLVWGEDLLQVISLAETIDLWCQVQLVHNG